MLGGATLVADVRQEAFLAEVGDARPSVVNPPWASFVFERAGWSAVAQFKNSRLVQIRLLQNLPGDELGWNAPTENETIRKRIHDELVRAWTGSRARFDWGRIESSHDPRGGETSIVITYRNFQIP